MKRLKQTSGLCFLGAVTFSAWGVSKSIKDGYVEGDTGSIFFMAGMFLVFMAIALVIERATPSKK